jgi:hypothetical protein
MHYRDELILIEGNGISPAHSINGLNSLRILISSYENVNDGSLFVISCASLFSLWFFEESNRPRLEHPQEFDQFGNRRKKPRITIQHNVDGILNKYRIVEGLGTIVCYSNKITVKL